MKCDRNEHGVIQYPHSDDRRLLVLLAAIDELERATLTTLAEFTGLNKGVIPRNVEILREQFGVEIEKDGPVYSLVSWGPLLKKGGVKKLLRG
ncbi:hypothetical protein [Paraburkholderia sediminicola]|uniref:hypothetical protein n=1 Tax=Paraburkholderia sediminicola TaxID=458836 RepID=UPI0038BB04CA